MRVVGHPKKGAPRPTGQDLYDLYLEQGKTQQEIAELYGVTESSVQRWIKRMGFQKERQLPNDRYAYKQRMEVLNRYEAGDLRDDLAYVYEVTVRTIDRWLNRARKEREQA